MTAALDIPVLETERLRLRAWRAGDLAGFARTCASVGPYRFGIDRHPGPDNNTSTFAQRLEA